MDSRRLVPLGTAALALVVLVPLGYQLYGSTALTSPKPQPVEAVVTAPAQPTLGAATDSLQPQAGASTPSPQAPAEAGGKPVLAAAPLPDLVPPVEQMPVAKSEAPAVDAAAAAPAIGTVAPPPPPAPEPSADNRDAADLSLMPEAASRIAPYSAIRSQAATSAPPEINAPVEALPPLPAVAPAPASVALSPIATPNGDKFQSFTESAQKAVATDPVSTFSIDVDTASYSYVRRALNEGRIPEPDAVRLEEMINYFPYDYPAATSRDVPFKPTISVFPTPWNKSTEIMAIGIKGYVPPASARQPDNLVFLVDTSGSMDEPDKLPLLQRALTLLVNTLSPDDTVSIVSYAGSAGVVLEPTKASDRTKILTALDNLEAGGSTAGAEGIELAYQLAEQHKLASGNNRVILATDGDFNVGIADPDALKKFIKGKRQSGIGLSVLGFGEGNLDDATMQALAQNGDGNASYIDSLSEAQKVLVKEAGSTLDTIAKDVKIQVEFNPANVSSYRLIGYETRALNREDFNNGLVDAGDVGAGHTVTALYEITPVGASPSVDPLRYGPEPVPPIETDRALPLDPKAAELADFKLRYKLPGSDTSQLIEQPVTTAIAVTDIAKASDDARWAAAVAAFGQKLKGSDYAGSMSYGDIATLARGSRGSDPDGYRAEFVRLVGLADGLSGTGVPQGGR